MGTQLFPGWVSKAFFWLSIAIPASAIDLDVSSKNSICSATALIQDGIMDYYDANNYGGSVGMFQAPYYWWEAGEVFGGMLENWYLCQNTSYEQVLYDSMLAQAGPDYDYMPSNQSMVEGNDDQGVWGLTVMGAVERNFTNPTEKGVPGWLAMVQGVFNTMYSRWDDQHCGGGVRWQIFTWNSGYNYKNTISNACLFQLAARLGRYTGNDTYIDVAEKIFDWMVDVGYIVLNDTANVYDGANIDDNCTDITKLEWSYNQGVVLGGAAYMYNATNGSSEWETRLSQVVGGSTSLFFRNKIMYEMTCQDAKSCNNDQRSFKSIFSRMLSLTSVLAPYTADTINPLMEASAEAAAKSCTGGSDGHTCGMNWETGSWDGYYGLGEQACALEVIQSLLYDQRPAPYTDSDGGTSVGDANAGLNKTTTNVLHSDLKITHKDKVGAAILTAVVIAVLVGGSVWMMF
ncbi:LAME_0F14532g1_1 [Lachancea meyersii CBS 8951]|uniref:Mannan endo-1,6-alpha-mannosidase n=1 Tax=Lachancea meyersii CBS 8951 TaxID=1266667 RepID=A0A1G4JY31_9SACH|nr:LAME_0F14532g1_1 [Lachancea meyersii CBS 8951]